MSTSILHHYQHLQAPLGLGGFEQGVIQAETKQIDFSHVTALDECIAAAEPLQGWLCFQSSIARHYTAETLPLRNKETGYLLSAEFVLPDKNGQTHSLHIRMTDTAWQVITLSESATHDRHQLIEKARFLAMPERQQSEQADKPLNEQPNSLTTSGNTGNTEKKSPIRVTNDFLTYRINWQHHQANGYQPCLYRFTGFKRNVTHEM